MANVSFLLHTGGKAREYQCLHPECIQNAPDVLFSTKFDAVAHAKDKHGASIIEALSIHTNSLQSSHWTVLFISLRCLVHLVIFYMTSLGMAAYRWVESCTLSRKCLAPPASHDTRASLSGIDDILRTEPGTQVTRHCLSIGIKSYEHRSALNNAINDAKAVSGAFRSLNYSCFEAFDLDERGFRRELNEFTESLTSTTDIIVIYFAGHGEEINGKLVLLPRDSPSAFLPDTMPHPNGIFAQDIVDSMVSHDRIGSNATIIALFDCCRSAVALESVSKTPSKTVGTHKRQVVWMWSCLSGQGANDSAKLLSVKDNGPFAYGLCHYLRQDQPYSIVDLYQKVNTVVKKATCNRVRCELSLQSTNADGFEHAFVTAGKWGEIIKAMQKLAVHTELLERRSKCRADPPGTVNVELSLKQVRQLDLLAPGTQHEEDEGLDGTHQDAVASCEQAQKHLEALRKPQDVPPDLEMLEFIGSLSEERDDAVACRATAETRSKGLQAETSALIASLESNRRKVEQERNAARSERDLALAKAQANSQDLNNLRRRYDSLQHDFANLERRRPREKDRDRSPRVVYRDRSPRVEYVYRDRVRDRIVNRDSMGNFSDEDLRAELRRREEERERQQQLESCQAWVVGLFMLALFFYTVCVTDRRY